MLIMAQATFIREMVNLRYNALRIRLAARYKRVYLNSLRDIPGEFLCAIVRFVGYLRFHGSVYRHLPASKQRELVS